MARLTGAFILRCWQGRANTRFRGEDVWRIEIVRIEDGERTVFASVEEAWDWLRTQLGPPESCAPPGGGETP